MNAPIQQIVVVGKDGRSATIVHAGGEEIEVIPGGAGRGLQEVGFEDFARVGRHTSPGLVATVRAILSCPRSGILKPRRKRQTKAAEGPVRVTVTGTVNLFLQLSQE